MDDRLCNGLRGTLMGADSFLPWVAPVGQWEIGLQDQFQLQFLYTFSNQCSLHPVNMISHDQQVVCLWTRLPAWTLVGMVALSY